MARDRRSDGLRRLSEIAGLSPNHFQRVFTRSVGLSPRHYCDHRRLTRLKELLQKARSVAEAAYAAGYGSARALCEIAARCLGMTPYIYSRGGPGVGIRYATLLSALGWVLVAVTDSGVCTVLSGASEDAVLNQLACEMPLARLSREA